MIKFVFVHWKAVVSAGIIALLYASVFKFATVPVFLLSIVLWGAWIGVLFRDRFSDRAFLWDAALLFLTYVGAILLMSLTEWPLVTRALSILAALSIGAFVAIIEQAHDDVQVYIKKAYRRMLVMGWVFVYGSLCISTYAVSVFFPDIPMWMLFVCIGIFASSISYAVWRLYYPIALRRFSLWLLLTAVISMETFWVIHLLPFGYIVLGFLAAWIWYILLLLIRFHMSAEGIRWKKQRIFLIENAVLFILILFVIRWI